MSSRKPLTKIARFGSEPGSANECTDPRIRLRLKLSRIRNTERNTYLSFSLNAEQTDETKYLSSFFSGLEPLVTFYPCEHRVVCSDCATRVKKCLTCHVPLEKRLPGTGAGVAVAPTRQEKERLKSLELKVQVRGWGCVTIRIHRVPTLPPPPSLHVGAAGNHLNEEINPILLTGIGERYCQTISNLGLPL